MVMRGISRAMFNVVHGRNLVYNACWEDPRLDRVALELGPDDTIAMITSAGCNALDYALQGPKHVHAVDVNPRQNALLELKQAGIRTLDYEQFFSLFGRGFVNNWDDVYFSKLRAELNPVARRFWDRRGKFFTPTGRRKSFYFHGTSGAFAWMVNWYIDRVAKIRPEIDELMLADTVEEQRELFDKYHLKARLWKRFVRWAMRRDTTLAMLGVPRAQRMQIEQQYPGGIAQFVSDRVEAVFTKLPLKDNYFWRVYMTGEYTPDCCPEYLKEENFHALRGGLVDRVSTHTDTLLGFLEKTDEQVSRYVLLDHMDWLSDHRKDLLALEWQGIVDRAAPNCRILWRSAGLKVDFIDPISVRVNGGSRLLGEMLQYNQELAEELHQKDRVHTYGSFYIANLNGAT